MLVEAKFIVLESIDDAMLDAQRQRLYRWLRGQGIAVEQTSEPTRGPVGALVRLCRQGRLQIDLLSQVLFEVADRMDHLGCQDGILSWLAGGRHVLCTRYYLSSYARHLQHVDLDWLRKIHARCRAPDLTLFLEIDPLLIKSSEALSNPKRLRENYEAVIKSAPAKIVLLSGDQEDIFDSCCRQIADLLG